MRATRKPWTEEEQMHLARLVHESQQKLCKLNWVYVSKNLAIALPTSTRNGKQCRERWLNYLKPRRQNPNFFQNQAINNNRIRLLDLIREHGKKWSLIAKDFPGQTQNSIKNFFYSSLRKGLRNMNVFHRYLRPEKCYKVLEKDFLTKLLSVNDDKLNSNVYLFNQQVPKLAEDLIQKIIQCSFQELNRQTRLPEDVLNSFEQLSQDLQQFCRVCKFRKSKNVKNKMDSFQYRIKPHEQVLLGEKKKKTGRKLRVVKKALYVPQQKKSKPKVQTPQQKILVKKQEPEMPEFSGFSGFPQIKIQYQPFVKQQQFSFPYHFWPIIPPPFLFPQLMVKTQPQI